MSRPAFSASIAGSLPKPAWLAETHRLWPQWKASGGSTSITSASRTRPSLRVPRRGSATLPEPAR